MGAEKPQGMGGKGKENCEIVFTVCWVGVKLEEEKVDNFSRPFSSRKQRILGFVFFFLFSDQREN